MATNMSIESSSVFTVSTVEPSHQTTLEEEIETTYPTSTSKADVNGLLTPSEETTAGDESLLLLVNSS